MAYGDFLSRVLAQRFGPEWNGLDGLTAAQRKLVRADFADLLRDEYDTPDFTMHDYVAEENAENASHEYRQRIGGGNLVAYAKSLGAGARRRSHTS